MCVLWGHTFTVDPGFQIQKEGPPGRATPYLLKY